MKLPLSWLSDYTDMSGITPAEYNHALTMSGSKVEGIEKDKVLEIISKGYTYKERIIKPAMVKVSE